MGTLKKIPKWGWVTGGIGLVLVALFLYEHNQNKSELDPCDPDNPEYEAENCPPPDGSQFPAKQMTVPSGAAGGTNYYLPLPGTGPGSKGSLPEEVQEEAPEFVEQTPPEQGGGTEIAAPIGVGGGIVSTKPGQPVPGSNRNEGLFGAVAAPAPGPVAPGQPVPGSGKGGGLFGAIQAPGAPPVHVGTPIGGGGSGSGGGGSGPSVGAGHPAPAPCGCGCQHPNAVFTGNGCVNGGVGGHTAPKGYHLFCCDGGIWRAPNS